MAEQAAERLAAQAQCVINAAFALASVQKTVVMESIAASEHVLEEIESALAFCQRGVCEDCLAILSQAAKRHKHHPEDYALESACSSECSLWCLFSKEWSLTLAAAPGHVRAD